MSAMFVLLLMSSPAVATTRVWFNLTGDWENSTGWSPAGKPVNGDVALLQTNQGDTVTRTAAATALTSPGLQQLELDGTNSWMILWLQGSQLYAGNEIVGVNGGGEINHTGGTNHVSNVLAVGFQGTANGNYGLSGANSSLVVDGALVLGYQGTASGTFLQSGGTVSTTGLWVSNLAGTKGYYDLGSGTLTAGSIAIGAEGAGTFENHAGSLNVTTDLIVGGKAGAAGRFTQYEGTTRVSGTTYIGASTGGLGTFEMLSGGTFRSDGDLVIGKNGYILTKRLATSTPPPTLEFGSGRTMWIDGGKGSVGGALNFSNGNTLRVINGGSLSSSSQIHIGASTSGGGSGTLIVSGTNSILGVQGNLTPSQWASQAGDSATIQSSDTAKLDFFCDLNIARTGGTASITATNGGRVWFDGTVIAGGGTTSLVTFQANTGSLYFSRSAQLLSGTQVNINGGRLSVRRLNVGTGAIINFNSGSFIGSDGQAGSIAFAGGEGSFSTSFKIPSGLIFDINNGGLVRSTSPFNIDTATTLTVSGVNSRLNVGLSGNAADVSVWGNTASTNATVNFASNGAGTFNAGLRVETVGTTRIDLSSSSTFFVKKSFDVGGAAASAATLTINSGTLTSSDSTRFGLNTDVTLNTGGLRLQNTSSIELGATLRWNGGTLELQNTTIGGNVLLSSGNNKVFRANSLDVTSTGKIDLWDNPMILDYTGGSPMQSVRQALQRGRLTNPTGITSSYVAVDPLHRALAYIESAALLGINGGTFANQGVDGTAVLVRYTLPGDANLDGSVDAVDLGKLATHWSATGVWVDGDFDYSGAVDVRDLYLLASNWKSKINGVPGAPFGPDLKILLSSLGLPPVSVPEPAAVAILSGGVALGLRRRRAGAVAA